jgi:hypothetical protein
MVTYLDDFPLLGFYATLVGSYRRFGTASPLKMNDVWFFKMSLTANPTTQFYIPELSGTAF